MNRNNQCENSGRLSANMEGQVCYSPYKRCLGYKAGLNRCSTDTQGTEPHSVSPCSVISRRTFVTFLDLSWAKSRPLVPLKTPCTLLQPVAERLPLQTPRRLHSDRICNFEIVSVRDRSFIFYPRLHNRPTPTP